MKKTLFLLLGFVLAAFAGFAVPAGAQESLTLEDCLRSAREKNRSLTAASLSVKEAQARVREAEVRRLPSLTAGAAYTRLSQETPGSIGVNLPQPIGKQNIQLAESATDAVSFQLDLQYPLFSGFRIQAGVDLARVQAEMKQKEYRLRDDDLAFEILRYFWDSVRARDSLATIEKSLELVKVHAEEVRRLAAAGLAVREDVLKVEMRIAKTELLRIEAETGYDLALLRLKTAAGLPQEKAVRPAPAEGWNRTVPKAASTAPEAELKGLLDRAFSKREELTLAGNLVRAREKAKTIAQADYYPSLLIVGNYTFAKPNSRIFPPPSGFEDTWQVGVAAKIDIGGLPATAARTAQASALEESAWNDFEALRERIVLEVTERYLGLRKAEQAVAASATLKAQAEESLKAAEEKFKNGLAKSSDVLEEQTNLLQAELSVTGSAIDRTVAEAALKRALGELNAR